MKLPEKSLERSVADRLAAGDAVVRTTYACETTVVEIKDI